MKIFFLSTVSFAILIATLAACTEVSPAGIPPVGAQGHGPFVRRTMPSFRSEQELAVFLRQIANRQRARREANQSSNLAMDAAAPAAEKAKEEESVTNNQHAGVDEGGIVKLHGNHLVVLRRGRLFTVRIGDNQLRPVSAVDAFAPDIDPRHTWYDEMLVAEDTVVVIGYSYERGGTEIGLFNIDEDGDLSYRSTHHLRSNDYYSSRNYASRLVGNKLIYYTPLYLYPSATNLFQGFPAVRKWHKGATPDEFRRIVSASRVFRPARDIEPSYGLTLHTVTTCDLANDFKCEATSVLGPAGRVFYVSPQAVYVWVTDFVRRGDKQKTESMVYRMPLDGSEPSAVGVSGSPVDQFSFFESDDSHLNVLVRSDAVGEAMWGSEVAAGDVALMRVPLFSFSDGSRDVPSWNYRKLVKPEGYTFQNRFIGDYLLYGTGSGWNRPEETKHANLHVVRWAGGGAFEFSLPHGVDRIEAMRSDAVIIGTDGKDLHFTAMRLGGNPELAFRYTRENASQGELRSHGFFYKSDGPTTGMLGLPISTPGRPGYRHLFDSSASILFLKNDSTRFQEIGTLASQPERAVSDACRASCVDWYGNARPLFVRG
ncbi:MAG TPA: beta-propeller domain-containing protein, partial [Pyrinomonadaceae bacterium]